MVPLICRKINSLGENLRVDFGLEVQNCCYQLGSKPEETNAQIWEECPGQRMSRTKSVQDKRLRWFRLERKQIDYHGNHGDTEGLCYLLLPLNHSEVTSSPGSPEVQLGHFGHKDTLKKRLPFPWMQTIFWLLGEKVWIVLVERPFITQERIGSFVPVYLDSPNPSLVSPSLSRVLSLMTTFIREPLSFPDSVVWVQQVLVPLTRPAVVQDVFDAFVCLYEPTLRSVLWVSERLTPAVCVSVHQCRTLNHPHIFISYQRPKTPSPWRRSWGHFTSQQPGYVCVCDCVCESACPWNTHTSWFLQPL